VRGLKWTPAARLNESIRGQLGALAAAFPGPESLPTPVKTLHRLLGTLPGSRHFRHTAARPLPADLVVVDEASMVDVEMMACLLEAMRPDARLILLGDKDQLSSVEAGAVLGDLCRRAAGVHFSPRTAAWLEEAAGQRIPAEFIDAQGRDLDQAIAMLRDSYRFSAKGGIGALAALVNQTDVVADAHVSNRDRRLHAVQALFARERTGGDHRLGAIDAIALAAPDASALADLVLAGYGGPDSYLDVMHRARPAAGAPEQLNAWATAVLEAQKRFQLLTPLRSGPWGIEGLNAFILGVLRAAGRLRVGAEAGNLERGVWFAGRPVLVTRNDYGLNLMNGDIGVTLAVPPAEGASGERPTLRVAFPNAEASGKTSGETSGETSGKTSGHSGRDGGVRWVLPSRLQAVETVFAMTVHKSQGSEFTHTALVLPDRSNPVLTRELLYTAITRARLRFTLLHGSEAVLAEALERRVQRVSGLSL
jgi:exodeoxyribonuclease V alpha subunit